MPTVKVGKLTFEFPNGWKTKQLDEWAYYRNQFLNLGNNVRMACSRCRADLRCAKCDSAKTASMKACDIVALDMNTNWLIEVKDYRNNQREKTIDLADEIALKIRDSLAVLLGAKARAEGAERDFAEAAVECSTIRVVLHLEQPAVPSKVNQRKIRPADVLQKLRQLVKAIDPHALVVETTNMKNLPWTVS